MTDIQEPSHRSLVARWRVELAVAALLALLAVVAIVDALRVGAGWGDSGPEPGFFPFYVGLVLFAASLWTGVGAVRGAALDQTAFVSVDGFRSVLAVLVPAILFIGLTYWLGIYLSAALLIGGFMRWRGGFGLLQACGLAVAIVLVLFAIFELWFLMPLPKGPIEAALGL